MNDCHRFLCAFLLLGFWPLDSRAEEAAATLPGTQPLRVDRPLDVVMVEGIDRFCLKEIASARELRESRWKRNSSSPAAYQKSLEPYREKFRTIIGAVDRRVAPIRFEIPLNQSRSEARLSSETTPAATYSVETNRWPTLPGMTAEGLVLIPTDPNWKGLVIALPDSRWSPDVFVGAASGGGYFVYKAWVLAREPSRKTAMGAFFASLLQLGLLLLAATVDSLL